MFPLCAPPTRSPETRFGDGNDFLTEGVTLADDGSFELPDDSLTGVLVPIVCVVVTRIRFRFLLIPPSRRDDANGAASGSGRVDITLAFAFTIAFTDFAVFTVLVGLAAAFSVVALVDVAAFVGESDIVLVGDIGVGAVGVVTAGSSPAGPRAAARDGAATRDDDFNVEVGFGFGCGFDFGEGCCVFSGLGVRVAVAVPVDFFVPVDAWDSRR